MGADRPPRHPRRRPGRRGRLRAPAARRPRRHRAPRPRAQRAPRDDRHAARRRARLVWQGSRRHADPRPPRRWGRAVRAVPRPERGDAALPREHPFRPLPLRPRYPRQCRLPLPRRRRDPGHAPQGAGLPHRGLRERLSPRLALRSRPRLRCLRRPLRRPRITHRVPDGGAARR